MPFNFSGAAASTSAKPGFSFGATSSTSKPASSSFSFDTQASSNTKPNTSFSFNTPSTASKPNTTSTSGFSFGNSDKPKITSNPTTTGFSFGQTAKTGTTTSTGTSSSSFNFGASLGSNANQNKQNTTNSGLNFSFNNLPDTKTQTKQPEKPENTGLGGWCSNNPADGNLKSILKKKQSDEDNQNPKSENTQLTDEKKQDILASSIPKELTTDVSNLEKHIKNELENHSRSIQRNSSRAQFDKVANKLKSCNNSVNKLNSSVKQIMLETGILINSLRSTRDDSIIAQNTANISSNLQFENTAPLGYLYKQVERFYSTLENYNKQLSDVELALYGENSNFSNSNENENDTENNALKGVDLIQFLDKYQNSFVQVACAYFSMHNSMQELKQKYLIFRNEKYPEKEKLVFGTKNINISDNSIVKQAKIDDNSSPFSAYSTHILANIVKSNITKQITSNTQNSTFGQNANTSSTNMFGNNNIFSNQNTGNNSGTNFFSNSTSNPFASKSTASTSGFNMFGSKTATNTSTGKTGGFSFGNTTNKPASSSSGFSFNFGK